MIKYEISHVCNKQNTIGWKLVCLLQLAYCARLYTQNIQKTRKLHSTGGSSAGCLHHEYVTLTFDL